MMAKKFTVATVYLIGFIDLFGVSMMMPLLPKLIHSMEASRSLTGLIVSLYGGIQIFSSPLVGKMSDLYDRKKFLLFIYFGSCLSYYLLSSSYSLWLLVISRLISGLLKHGITVSKAYLTDITLPDNRPSVFGYFSAFSNMGFIVGPILAGYLADADPSLRMCFFTAATIYGMNVFLIFFLLPSFSAAPIRGPAPSSSPPNESAESTARSVGKQQNKNDKRSNGYTRAVSHVTSILQSFSQWRTLADVITVRFLGMMAMMIFRYDFAVFLETNFSISNATLGKAISFSGLTMTVASALCGVFYQHYRSKPKYIKYFFALLFASFLCLMLAQSIGVVLICLVTISFATANLRICMLNLILHRGQERDKGAIIGMLNSISSISRMLGPSIVGVAQEYGSRTSVFLASMLSMLGLVGLLVAPIDLK